MIYRLWIKNNEGRQKEFYLTEDSKNKVTRRACTTYGVVPSDVILVAEYKETRDGYELVQEFIKGLTEETKTITEKASMLYKSASGRCEPYKSQYRISHKMTEYPIKTEEDIVELLNKFKVVKVYWQTTETRGEHEYYAFVK